MIHILERSLNVMRLRSHWLLTVLIGIALAMNVWEIPHRGLDPDEFEHLHASYCIFIGEVPYRDFFEHHGPLLYFLIQPAFLLCGPEISVIDASRCVMFACSGLILVMTGLIAKAICGRTAAWLAVSLLAWSTIFHAKAIEVRPDVPAALCLICAAWLCFKTHESQCRFGSHRRDLLCRWIPLALVAGLATLFTQKSIVPLAGMGLASVLLGFHRYRRFHVATGLALAGGVSLTWFVAYLSFSAVGAGSSFIDSTVGQLWKWPIRSSRWEQLRPTLVGDFALWTAAIAEIATLIRVAWRNQDGVIHHGDEARSREYSLAQQPSLWLALSTGFCLAGLIWVKAIYAQFYFLWMPWVAILAACHLSRWAGQTQHHPWFRAFSLVIVVLVAQVILMYRAIQAGTSGALSELSRQPILVGMLLALFVLIAIAAVATFRYRRWIGLLCVLVVAGSWYGILRNVETALWSNSSQMSALIAMDRLVGPGQTVFDGYTGYGCLKRHAFYYWWLNEYSMALIPEETINSLPSVLTANPPAVVLFDDNLKRLPPVLVDWIEKEYHPVDPAPAWIMDN